MNDTETEPLVFRSTAARVAAWAWVVFTVLNMLDLAIRGRDSASLVAAAMLLLGVGVGYVLGLRPRIVGDSAALTFHNPVRTVRASWPAVREIEAGDSVKVRFASDGAERTAKAWVLQSSPRARAKHERRAARDAASLPADVGQVLTERTAGDFAVERLNELRAASKSAADTGASVTWDRPAIAALGVPAVFLVAMVLVSVLT